MARLPEPRNAEGKTPKSRGTVGQPLPRNSINQAIPPAQGYFPPFIATAGDNAGDTCYFLLNSIFDPRTLQDNTGATRYSAVTPDIDLHAIWTDLLYQVVFSQFRMRQEPAISTIREMLDVIVDTTRCLGIYLSALSMSASRDPDMFNRARILGVYDGKVEMQSMLASLPLPRYLVELSLKYVGLVDVSGSYNYQNVGFLCTGDYEDFVTLYNAIISKPLARNFLHEIYPEIGLLGDPDGTRNSMDVLGAFINANYKTVTNGFAPYVVAEQSTDEPLRLAAGGLLSSYFISGTTKALTSTGWAVPGTGIGATGSVRSWFPAMCVWKRATGKDAVVIRNGNAQVYSVDGSLINVESIVDANLAVNIVHEYNMANDSATAPSSFTQFNGTTGSATAADVLSSENPRYRVSAGFSLGSVSANLQANVVSAFRDIFLPF